MAFSRPEGERSRLAQPIWACVGDHDSLGFPKGDEVLTKPYLPEGMSLDHEDMWLPGPNGFRFSTINSRDKSSRAYSNCTGMAIVGESREGREEISFLTHELAPGAFRNGLLHSFEKASHFFLKHVEPQTVDAVMFGGECNGTEASCGIEYQRSISEMSKMVRSTFGFSPRVIAGPNMVKETVDIFLHTSARKLYMVRPLQPIFADNDRSFSSGDIEQQAFLRTGNP